MVEDWIEELFKKLQQIQENNQGIIDINNIDEIIRDFIEVLNPYIKGATKTEIHHQLESVLAQFSALKVEISNVSREVFDQNFVPSINMDLRSVIIQTEQSVTNILDVCDEINELSKEISDYKIREELMLKSIKILEICNFQDLTGQRIQKIVHHLNEIESIIYKMLHFLKPDLKLKHPTKKEELVNGPQNSDNAPSQDSIDALFNNL